MSTGTPLLAGTASELPLDALDLAPEEVRARFLQARRRGHPAWLWPEVGVAAWRSALEAIEAAARDVLMGAPARLDADDGAALQALGVAAYTSGMGPLLGHWAATGALATSTAAGRLLALHLRHGRIRAARLTGELERVAAPLAEVGVAATVLKGLHTAAEYFPEPGARPCSDIDLLVPPGELGAVDRALRRAGYLPRHLQTRPYKCEWAPAGSVPGPRSLSLAHADDPWTLDVHTSLDRNFFGVGTARLDRLYRAAADAGAGLPASLGVLPQPLLLLFLATHASEGLHNLTVVRLVELAWVIRRDVATGALDWEEALAAAGEAEALRYAFPALELCERLAPGTIPGYVRARLAAAAPAILRRVVSELTPASAQRLDRLSLRERFMWAATPWERVRRAAHAVWPAPAGRSVAALGAIYGRRAWTLVRGRVER